MKKLFISADIEGVCGVTTWTETDRNGIGFDAAARQMTAEVAAACRGALAAGYEEILVKDAHGSAMNILHEGLPKEARLIRGWTGDTKSMMAFIDESCSAAVYVGYHSRAGSKENPLSHSFSSSRIYELRVNNLPSSEFYFNSLIAASYGVPSRFISGDAGVCLEAEERYPHIFTQAVKRCVGDASDNLHPQLACELIEEKVLAALSHPSEKVILPETFVLEMDFMKHQNALRASFYPGAQLVKDRTVRYECGKLDEMLTAFMFMS